MKRFSRHRGFTLIEVAVAMALVTMTFGGVMSLIIISRESSINGKNNLIAGYLAAEGLELVRSLRDDNYSAGEDVFESISDLDGEYVFTIDYLKSPTTQSEGLAVAAAPVLNLLDGHYTYSTDTGYKPTIFRRLVTTVYHDDAIPPYLTVTSSVFWKQDTKQHTETVTSQLTDWQ